MKYPRVFSWVILACIFAFGQVLLAAEVYVNPSVSTSGAAGSVTVSVSYLAQGASVSALQFDLHYDTSALTLVNIAAGSSTKAAGKSLQTKVQPNGDMRFIIFGANQTLIGDGSVVDLTIQVNASPSTTSYSLHILNQVASDPTGTTIALTAQDGSINIISPPKKRRGQITSQ